MRPIALLSALALCTCLTACKRSPKTEQVPMQDTSRTDKADAATGHGPDHHGHALRGTVDSVNALTIEDFAQLGIEGAKKRYLGKIVTIKGLTPVGIGAKNEDRQNVCMQGFSKWFQPRIGKFKSGGICVFFNFGEEIRRWDYHHEYRSQDLKPDDLLVLSEDVCDTAVVCNEGDPEGDRKCIFSSDRFLIAGRVIAVSTEGDGVGFSMDVRPTGLRY